MFKIISDESYRNYKDILEKEKEYNKRKDELFRLQSDLKLKEAKLKEVDNLQEQIEILKKEKKELQFQKDMELKEIQHLTKMKEEKNAIELDKKTIELEKKYVTDETKRVETYLAKVLTKQDEVAKDIKDLTNKVLDRFTINLGNMPNIQKDK